MSDYTREKWLRIRALRPSTPRFLHVSCEARMIQNPLVTTHVSLIPWVQRPGVTFNVGRNKAKRERRSQATP